MEGDGVTAAQAGGTAGLDGAVGRTSLAGDPEVTPPTATRQDASCPESVGSVPNATPAQLLLSLEGPPLRGAAAVPTSLLSCPPYPSCCTISPCHGDLTYVTSIISPGSF